MTSPILQIWRGWKAAQKKPVPYRKTVFVLSLIGTFIYFSIRDDSQLSTAESYDLEASSIESNRRALTVSAGDDVVLKWSDSETASHLAIDETAWDAMFEAINAKDTIGLTQLVQSGQVHLVPSGTKARVLFSGSTRHNVKLMDGPAAGVAGWVFRGFVQR